MNGNKSSFKRFARIGPGGMKCACCAPAPGKPRKQARRLWKRREKREAMRELRNQ